MSESQTREVCKICFNAFKQKTNQTLIEEDKVIEMNNERKCPNCKQPWSPQIVAFDTETKKWVAIRARPLKMNPGIDYQMCMSVQKKQPCSKGQGLCTFAHSRVELNIWNQERWKEPRQIPLSPSNQYQMCKHVITTGSCPYGQRCSFAHSDDELKNWMKSTSSSSTGTRPPPPQTTNNHLIGENASYFCKVCNIFCSGQRQYNDHLSGQKHRQSVAAAQSQPIPYSSVTKVSSKPPLIRKRPNRLPVNGYRLCISTYQHRKCYYGNRCTFAHSEEELKAWNEQRRLLRRRTRAPPVVLTKRSAPAAPVVPQSQSGLDDFEDELQEISLPPPQIETEDFANRLRMTVMYDHEDKGNELTGLEKSLQNVTISQISEQLETLTIFDNDCTPSWVYEISSNALKTLHSVVLFDVLDLEFKISSVDLVTYKGRSPIQVISKASHGEGLLLNQALNPPDKILVKIELLKPRLGLLGQSILFDFGSFYMIRCLSVHVVNEQDRRLFASHQRRIRTKPEKIDLFWDQHYEIIPWVTEPEMYSSCDNNLDEYPLPEVVENFIEEGKYQNVEQKVKKSSYKRRMHNLLYLEEYQERKDLSRYDLYDIKVDIKDRLELIGEWINDQRYSFIHIEMDEVLFEGGRSIRKDDYCLLKPNNQDVIHQCLVHLVQRDSVIVKITKIAAEACISSRNQCSLRFHPSRIGLRAMHQAIDLVDLDILFPEKSISDSVQPTLSDGIKRCMQELDLSILNQEQKKAIASMINPKYVQIPTLVLGPFGCGKTRTLLECVSFLSRYKPDTRILICTHTNVAADMYVEALHAEWDKLVKTRPRMYRLYFVGRKLSSVSHVVQSYSYVRNGKFVELSPSEILSHSIVVTTTIESRTLFLKGIEKGSFTHILIDEAPQVYEPELLITLCLADENTKVALAGDTMQMDPHVSSSIAKKYGLSISLLERLYENDFYKSNIGNECKTHLTENHRSHQKILDLPSKLFYEDSLTCKAKFPNNGPKHIPSLQFVGVDGQEKQDVDTPSYYNEQEVLQVAEEVERLVSGINGLNDSEVCVLGYFHLQVQRIRGHLRSKRRNGVQVHNINGIQGKEFRALIISTVRTCDQGQEENDEGFLNNIKLFNTAITRAKEWLIVVGEPITLCTVGYNAECWLEYIKRCIEYNTFRYPRSELFLKFLDNKVVARRIRQTHHKEFIEKSTAPLTANVVIAPPTASSQSSAGTGTDIRSVTQQVNSLSINEQQVIKRRVLQLMLTPENDIANKIADEVMKADSNQMSNFMNVQNIAMNFVRERESFFKRNSIIAAQSDSISSSSPQMKPKAALTTSPTGASNSSTNIMGELPMFLKSQVDSLTQHFRFCESQQSKASIGSELSKNLTEQRDILQQQMKLVNDQIMKYKEFSALSKGAESHITISNTKSIQQQQQTHTEPVTIKPEVTQHTLPVPPPTVHQLPQTYSQLPPQPVFTTPHSAMGVVNPTPLMSDINYQHMQQQQSMIPGLYGVQFPTMGPPPPAHVGPLHRIPPGISTVPQFGPMVQPNIMRQPMRPRYSLPVYNNSNMHGGTVISHPGQPMQSHPVSQTTQLISPLTDIPTTKNNNIPNKTWDSDEDLD